MELAVQLAFIRKADQVWEVMLLYHAPWYIASSKREKQRYPRRNTAAKTLIYGTIVTPNSAARQPLK